MMGDTSESEASVQIHLKLIDPTDEEMECFREMRNELLSTTVAGETITEIKTTREGKDLVGVVTTIRLLGSLPPEKLIEPPYRDEYPPPPTEK